MSKITLRIIAEETGLSKYAVSRALSGKSGVSASTRAQVLAVAERLGYVRPERSAPPASPVIGAIFDESDTINSEMNIQIQSGLQSEASHLGCTVIAQWHLSELDLPKFLDRCSGFFAVNVRDKATIAKIVATGKPLVRAGWLEPLEQVDHVGGTDREAGIAVGRYLYDLGHREIVFVNGDVDLRGRRERWNGVLEVASAGTGMRCHYVSWEQGGSFSESLDKILAQGGRPTGFFCAHDALAITAYTDLLARGWRIPRDVSVVGFGDYSAAVQVSPQLTTVRVRAAEFGRNAVRRLDARLRNPLIDYAPLRMMVPNILVQRESSGPASPAA
ncbi:LacI family DNA-binding transcriptional regulator [Halodurantibacterium flavum]|uniref:LacI family DNA-binding transcriptional regulator n=1 Tax=Halodurantibacterium flavum TaxID=1382802 RepID=A0ABW4RZI6_9RHOB